MARFTIFIAPLLMLGSIACSSGDDDDDDSTRPKDTGVVPDSGNDVADAGEVADSGSVEDTGVQGPCDPYAGTGCNQADEYCVFVLSMNMDQCRTLPAMNAHEAACSQVANDCAPGFACADLGGGGGPTCHKVCDTANGAQCNGLTGMSNDYVCTGITVTGGAAAIHGLCVGQDLCNPAEKAAACMPGETCSQVSQTETGCQTAGTAALNQPCTPQNNCVAGLICLDVGDGRQCYEGCDSAANPCSAGTDRCQGLTGQTWGICLPMGTACDPLAMPCMAGMTCSIVTGAAECSASGTAAVGQECNPNMQCVDTAVCAFLQNEATPLCYEPCDLAMPMCTAGQCGNLGLSFGLCVVP